MANWGDVLAESFSGSFQNAQQRAFQKWQMQNQQSIELAKANLFPDNNGDIVISGQRYSRRAPVMPDLSGLSPSGSMGVTGLTLDPMTGDSRITIGQTPSGKIEEKQGEKAADVSQLGNQAVNQLRTLVAAWKSMRNATGSSGRRAGIGNLVSGITGANPNVNPYEGQRNETAYALAKLANPSGRPGPQMAAGYKKGLPTIFSNDQEMANNVRDTLHNAMSRVYGAQGKQYTADERKKFDEMVQDIIDTPAYDAYSVGGVSTPQIDVKSEYNKLRSQGMSAEQAKKKLGL